MGMCCAHSQKKEDQMNILSDKMNIEKLLQKKDRKKDQEHDGSSKSLRTGQLGLEERC